MISFFRTAGTVILFVTSACSTVIEGPVQTIAVDSFPSGAECAVKDNDLILARVHTPGTAEIAKSKNDILVECSKDGYITASRRNRSDIAISSMGNMVLGQWSFIGNAVDSASGASHKYDSEVFMALNVMPPVARMQAEELPFASHTPSYAAPSIMAALPPEQLGLQLSHMVGAQDVIISHQSPAEILHLLATGQRVTGDAQLIAELAENPMPIQHSAE